MLNSIIVPFLEFFGNFLLCVANNFPKVLHIYGLEFFLLGNRLQTATHCTKWASLHYAQGGARRISSKIGHITKPDPTSPCVLINLLKYKMTSLTKMIK